MTSIAGAGDSLNLVSIYGSQPLVNRPLSSGVATWTGLQFNVTGLYKLNAASSVAEVLEEKSLTINISN